MRASVRAVQFQMCAVLLCLCPACGSSSEEAPAGGAGGSDADAAADSSGSDAAGDTDASGACPGTAGPAMVRVPEGFCIDSTEVTNDQYAAFLTAKASDTSGQDAWCSWNTSYTPSSAWPATDAARPVAFVDWCDAFAFCAWAGKRLCGKIEGGPSDYADYADAAKSQWHAACSAGGTLTFPYGNAYDGKACNAFDYSAGATVKVGTAAGCVGGYPGIHDMSGNVGEWEDSCEAQAGADDHCRERGGSFQFKNPFLACDGQGSPLNSPRNFSAKTIGIRCCGP